MAFGTGAIYFPYLADPFDSTLIFGETSRPLGGMLNIMDASTLHCPNCGAAISSDSTQCQYCNSLLQSAACPSCFGLIFVGSKFCPHCGAAVAAVDPGPEVAHACPRCPDAHLQAMAVGGVQLEECPHCGGIWVSNDVFNKICADRETQEATVNIQLPPPAAPQEYTLRYLKCPQCAKLMNRYNFADRSGVVIDKCRLHGVWLDRDDLRRVIEFIRGGGLTFAREHEIEKLQLERQQLQSDRHSAGMAGGPGSYIGTDRGAELLGGIASILGSFLR